MIHGWWEVCQDDQHRLETGWISDSSFIKLERPCFEHIESRARALAICIWLCFCGALHCVQQETSAKVTPVLLNTVAGNECVCASGICVYYTSFFFVIR